MQIDFPSIYNYEVSPTFGFLPPHPPLRSLPTQYKHWDELASHLSTSIAHKALRFEVDSLPIISSSKLTSLEQLHRAFVVLGFLIHGYVWCDGSDRPEPNVPPQLGEPYLEVCDRLGMQPTLSYAGLCLWNWQIKKSDVVNGANGVVNGVNGTNEVNGVKEHLSRLHDLNCLVSFTGTWDEAVFYLIPVMVEAEGGQLVHLLLEAMKEAAQNGDNDVVVKALEDARDALPRMSALIKHLHEECDAKVFYQKVRPFYPGAKGMEEKGMPEGVWFHREDGSKVSAKCVGGSAAQSSYFPFIDSALGVKHRPVGNDKGETVFQASLAV